MCLRILCVTACIATLANHIVLAQQQIPRFTPAGPDPRNRAREYIEPTQAIVHVEHVEEIALESKYAKAVDDLKDQIRRSSDPAEIERLENKLRKAEEEARRRVIRRYSGYIAVLGHGDGRFNDRSPNPKYYLVGTAEIEPKDNGPNVKLWDYLLLPAAIGGENSTGETAFCKTTPGNTSRPRIISKPTWWRPRDLEFAPPWECPSGPFAKAGILSSTLKPVSDGKKPPSLNTTDGTFIRQPVKIRNESKRTIDAARFVMRAFDEQRELLCVLSKCPPDGKKRDNSRRRVDQQEFPELGKMAMAISDRRDALCVRNLGPNETIEIEVLVPEHAWDRIKSLECLVTYLDS